jgi:predicted DNA-binding antitoxin AbrB/MazE fold protein
MEIPAIYENGVFRPLEPVALPEKTPVTVTAQTPPVGQSPLGCNTDRLYELLSQSVETGIPDLAARHNEHQP